MIATVTYRTGTLTTAVYSWSIGADGHVWWNYIPKADR